MPNRRERAAVFQFFYHCKGERLPVRDFLNTQRQGHKTEPHYENLTENWCNRCMPSRIRSANHYQVEYLFLVTTYRNPNHPQDGKRLVVGYLHRAKPARWIQLNGGISSGAKEFHESRPEECEFFAGDSESHFVAVEGAYELGVRNPRWKYFADQSETDAILSHLRRSKNVLAQLIAMVSKHQKPDAESTCPPPRRNRVSKC